jgi:hypothetical protein
MLTEYQRLDQAIGATADRVRGLVDDWYRLLPAHAQSEIHQRFTEPSLGAHLSAFWETYLHEATRRLDFDVEIDIGRDHGDRRPDLLIDAAAAGVFFEATVALGAAAVRRDQRARADQLYAAVERVRNRDFLLHIELRRVGDATPGRKLVTDRLDAWLDTMDPDVERKRAAAGEAACAIVIDKHGWYVRIEATGTRAELREDREAGVIGSRVEGFAEDAAEDDLLPEIDDITPLTNVLLKKAGHGYELDDRPFVIVVLCAGEFIDEHDIAQALFGQIEYQLSMSSDHALGRFVPGGLWHEAAGLRYTNVSAVLTASNLTPWGVAAVEPCLWLNPAAVHPIDTIRLPWRQWEIDPSGRFVERAATMTSAELFGLPTSWPVDEPSEGRCAER